MRSLPNALIEPFRAAGPPGTHDGYFLARSAGAELRIVASVGSGWEHVSVSLAGRCPTWEEMCYVKELFWKASETVIQFHPTVAAYVNHHPYCLHLWRPIGANVALPPTWMVGPTKGELLA